MTTSAQEPFPRFVDLDGTSLTGGYVYIGTANLDPVTNPINIFSDAACTVGLSQPLRISGSFVVDGNGAPTNIYVAGTTDFSMAVANRFGSVRYSVPSYPVRFTSDSITFGTVSVETSIVADAAGGAVVGTNALAFSEVVAQSVRTRTLELYSQTQPAAASDLNKLTQLMMPLLAVNQNTLAGAPTWFNALNVNTGLSSRSATGNYTVVPTVALPSTSLIVQATVRDAIGARHCIIANVTSTTSIAVQTFFPATNALDDATWSLSIWGNPAEADPIL